MKRILAAAALLSALTGRSGAAQQVTAADSMPAARDSVPSYRVALPERPTVATHAYTVAPGVVEIEAGVQAMRPSGASQTVVPVVVKLGVAPGVQVELIGGWSRQTVAARPAAGPVPAAPGSSTGGFGDLAIAPKFRLLSGVPLLGDVSVQPSLKLATGSLAQGTGTGTTDGGLLLISSRKFGGAELDLNAGMTLRSGDGQKAPRTAGLLTASFGSPVAGALGWVLELFDYTGTSGPAGAAPQVGLLTGPTLTVQPWLVLDAGAIANVHGFPANSAYAGVTWNVGRIR